jgi:hypothetical protein
MKRLLFLLLVLGAATAQKLPSNTVDCDPHVINGKEVSHCEIDDGPPKQGPPTLEYNGAMPTADLLLRVNGGLVAEVPMCDDWVKFGHTARLVSDLFPEECKQPGGTYSRQQQVSGAGYGPATIAADIAPYCHIEHYVETNASTDFLIPQRGWYEAKDLRIVCGTKSVKP